MFGRELQGIPIANIREVYRPQEALAQLGQLEKRDSLQQDVVTFAETVKNMARIDLERLGISGSVQVGLHGPTSDIDLIVYGKREGRAVQLALRRAQLSPEQGIQAYRFDTYRPVYNLRWSASGIPIDKMLLVDGLKATHGIFGGHHYFVRAVLDWDEVQELYGDHQYRALGYAKVRCRISDHSMSLYTPCQYAIENVELIEGTKVTDLREIVSFRGRFCEQAKQDEEVLVQGTVEEVRTESERWTRFLLGDRPMDILIPSSLL